MSDVAIRVEGLSKAYRIGVAEQRHETLMGAVTSFIKSPLRNFRDLRKLSRFDDVTSEARTQKTKDTPPSSVLRPPSSDTSQSDLFWALKDVSFEVKRGEAVGIIGRNGAGKSTLLKILARITEPTRGRAEIHGRVGSLLEVGTGFHPDLTGRENIYLNGTILGMKKREVDARFDEIVAFSGVEKFIDTPVKRYSSGMRVRLAFSVAAHMEPEVLIIDEVLAVGDAAFQEKCLGKMEEVARHGRTVLFVSHNMPSVEALCERVIVLNSGLIVESGEPEEVISRYLNKQLARDENLTMSLSDLKERGVSGPIRFLHWTLASKSCGEGRTVACGEACEFRLSYQAMPGHLPIRGVSLTVVIKSSLDRPLFTIGNEFTNDRLEVDLPQGVLTCALPRLPLLPGNYFVHLWCSWNGQTSDVVKNAGSFCVLPRDIFGTGKLPKAEKHGVVIVDHQSWRCLPSNSKL